MAIASGDKRVLVENNINECWVRARDWTSNILIIIKVLSRNERAWTDRLLSLESSFQSNEKEKVGRVEQTNLLIFALFFLYLFRNRIQWAHYLHRLSSWKLLREIFISRLPLVFFNQLQKGSFLFFFCFLSYFFTLHIFFFFSATRLRESIFMSRRCRHRHRIYE